MSDFRFTNVDSLLINNAVADIDKYISELQTIATAIENGIMPSLNPYWDGQAKRLFEQKFNSDSVNVKDLVARYKELNGELKKAGNEYGKADDSVRQTIAKLPK